MLDTSAELIQSYRLRYEVFQSLGYLQRANQAILEIDEYDAYAIPFGAISLDTQELVGTLRLITRRAQPFYALRIQRILALCDDPELSTQALRRRSRLLPSITSSRIDDCLARWSDGRQTEELSRTIIHPSFRGSGVSRGLMEFGLAYSMIAGGADADRSVRSRARAHVREVWIRQAPRHGVGAERHRGPARHHGRL